MRTGTELACQRSRAARSGPSQIWGRFADFMANNYKILLANSYSDRDLEWLPIPELMTCMRDWIARNTHRS
jgi:hypothetical protein